MITPTQNQVNPNQLQPNAINPNAFSNTAAIQGVYGNQIPNTFNRSIGPIDPLTGQIPVNPQMQQPQAVPTTF